MRSHYKYIHFISMLFITLMLISAVLVNRILYFHGILEPGGILVFPITYICSDIIAEIYGYKISRHILWCGLACQFIFSVLMYLILKLPTPPSFHFNSDFNVVFSHLIRYSISFTIGTIAGGYLNIYFVSKLKVVYRGRYFWIRSLLSTSVGELIFTIITLGPVLLVYNNLSEVFSILISAYLFKLSYGVLFLPIANLCVKFLKKAEKIDESEQEIKFNPFIIGLS